MSEGYYVVDFLVVDVVSGLLFDDDAGNRDRDRDSDGGGGVLDIQSRW